MFGNTSGLRTLIAGIAIYAAISSTPLVAEAEPISNLVPVTSSQLENAEPGLGVQYFRGWKFDSIREILELKDWKKPRVGEPLPMLNYNVGPGDVLTTKSHDLVGAFIDGYIKFDQAGLYLLAVQHNDGVRLSLGGQEIYEDPIVASDRFSPNLEVQIDQPGWYEISLIYYEKKGTSTLELYWQAPGTDEFEFVPAEAFRHTPRGDETT